MLEGNERRIRLQGACDREASRLGETTANVRVKAEGLEGLVYAWRC